MGGGGSQPPHNRGGFTPRGMNGGAPFDGPRNSNWNSGSFNNGNGGSSSLINQSPPSVLSPSINQPVGNNRDGSRTSTQVTIPKDVSNNLYETFMIVISVILFVVGRSNNW